MLPIQLDFSWCTWLEGVEHNSSVFIMFIQLYPHNDLHLRCTPFNLSLSFMTHSGTGGRILKGGDLACGRHQLRASSEAPHPDVQRCASGIRSRPKRIICASVWGSCAEEIARYGKLVVICPEPNQTIMAFQTQAKDKAKLDVLHFRSDSLQAAASGLSYCSIKCGCPECRSKALLDRTCKWPLRYFSPRGPTNLRH